MKTAAIKSWDSRFMDNRLARAMNRRAFDMVPFHELPRSEQSLARRAYPHKSVGAKYDFIDEHYYYPVDRNGNLGRGQRSLAIPYKLIMDDEYMAGLGYEVNPEWKGASVRVASDKVAAMAAAQGKVIMMQAEIRVASPTVRLFTQAVEAAEREILKLAGDIKDMLDEAGVDYESGLPYVSPNRAKSFVRLDMTAVVPLPDDLAKRISRL